MEFLRGKNLVILIVLIVLAIVGPLWVAYGLGFKNLSNSDWIAFSGFYVAIFGAILSAFLGGAWGHHVATIKEMEKQQKVELALDNEICFLKNRLVKYIVALDDEFEVFERKNYISSISFEGSYISGLLSEVLVNGTYRTLKQIDMMRNLSFLMKSLQCYYDRRCENVMSTGFKTVILKRNDSALIMIHTVKMIYAINRLELDGENFDPDNFEIDKRQFYVVYGLSGLSMTEEKFNKLSSHLNGVIDKHSI